MKRFLVGLALTSSFFGAAQDGDKALLWRISGNGLERPGYLYGTVHSKDERAYSFAAAVEEAIQHVNTVAGELDLEASRKEAASLMIRMMMPDDQRLEDLYKKKDWAKVDAYLKSELGFMAAMVQRMKPFFVMATLTETVMGGARPMVLDEYLMAQAKAKAHRTIGLETMDEQLSAMDALPLKEQAAMLLEQVESDGMRDVLDQMLDAYVQQDIDALMEISQAGAPMPEEMERALLIDRNAVMVHRMDSVLRADGSSMFLVGAAHLPGRTGILHLLRGKGYSTEAVPLEAAKAPEFGPALFMDSGIHYVNDTLAFGVDMFGTPALEPDEQAIMIGVKHEDRGTLVMVIALSNEKKKMELDSLFAKEFLLGEVDEVESCKVQGHDGRMVFMEQKGIQVAMLMVRKDDDVYITTSFGSSAAENRKSLESFHFTDVPE